MTASETMQAAHLATTSNFDSRSVPMADRVEVRERTVSGREGAARSATGTSAVVVEVHRSPDAINLLEPEWRALEDEARVPCFFASAAWCRHLIETFPRSRGAEAIDPVIVTARRDGRLVALWPLAIQRTRLQRVLTSLGAPFDQYSEVLIAQGEERADVLRELTSALRAARIADGLVLRKARSEGDVRELEAFGATLHDNDERAPHVSIDVGASFKEFLATTNAKTRKNLRNYTNRLGRLGKLEHRIYSGEDITTELVTAFEGRRKWLDSNGLSSTAFRDGRFSNLVASLGGRDAADLGLIAFDLCLDDRPICLQWGFVHQGCYTAFMSARDPEFDAYSAGRIHLLQVIEACHARGIADIDLLVPASAYKMTWTNDARPVVDVVWPWTVRGHVMLRLVEEHLRPRAKALLGALPIGLRQRVMRLLNR